MEYIKDLPMEDDTVPKSRRPWSKEEDGFLIQFVNTYGVGHWSTIAQALKERTGISRTTKQCRNRWINSLTPTSISRSGPRGREHDMYTAKSSMETRAEDCQGTCLEGVFLHEFVIY